MEQVALNQSSLVLKNILQNTQTLLLFTKIIKTESINKSYKSYKSWKTWVQISSGKFKREGGDAEALKVSLQNC
jgi:hypothetical protein